MLLHGSTSSKCYIKCLTESKTQPTRKPFISIALPRISPGQSIAVALAAAAATATLVLSAGAIEVAAPSQPEETLSNVPQSFSSVCTPEQKDCKKMYRIQKPKSRKAEKCTSKCATTCMQGGYGAPGEGPFTVRRPLVVFKDGFRSRKYCLSECSDICNLIGDGDDGP